MTTEHERSGTSDASLVALCADRRAGAFRAIVERYQGLVCGLIYSACGDVHQSEDLAQETFLRAWRNLPGLKDATRLRPWLCGIARNLVRSARRKTGRRPGPDVQLPAEMPDAPSATPAEDAISREQQTLIWDALARLPEMYREPLVLYYRQEESTAAVAEALEISEQAVRQRLARGRAMLAQRVEALVSRGLRATGPGKAFTLAVIAVIPGIAVSAGAATIGATAVKGSASAKAAASGGGLAGSLLGPLIGLAGGYLGYRIGLDQTITPDERRFMRRWFRNLLGLVVAFLSLFLGSMFVTRTLGAGPLVRILVPATIAVGYAVVLVFLCLWYQRRIRQLRAKALASDPDAQVKAREVAARWKREYRSRWTLLGLPLIHINVGATPDATSRVAKGWIAVGGKAYGVVFAAGGVAVGAVSFGGFAVGLLTWGGFAVGAFCFGGFAVGIWALGGLAVGYRAMGGCALAWSAAHGGVALARDYALGGVALAPHANDEAARTFFRQDPLSQVARGARGYAHWLWVVAAALFASAWLRWRALRRAADPGQGQRPS